MSKLPFVVKPRLQPRLERIGNEEVGVIEIERRGYLTVAEKAFVEAQLAGDTTTDLFIRLTRSVARELKLDMNAAYKLITEVIQGTGGMTPNHKKIEEKYQAEMDELMREMQRADQTRVLTSVYALLLYRVDAELDAEELAIIHPDLVGMLYEFYLEEESKTITRLEELTEDMEENKAATIEDLEKK